MKKTLLLISLLMLVLSMLVACGGGAKEAPAPAPAQPAATQPPAAAAMPMGDAAKGKEAFATCAGCHGPEGKGLPGLGKDMTTSTFIKGQTDEQLMAFVKTGRPASDPAEHHRRRHAPQGRQPGYDRPADHGRHRLHALAAAVASCLRRTLATC